MFDVNTLNKLGGILLAAGLILAVVIGYQTPTGRAFWDGIFQAARTVVGFIRENVPTTPAQGNPLVSIGAAAIAFALIITFFEGARHGKPFAFAAIVSLLLGLVAYNPNLFAA